MSLFSFYSEVYTQSTIRTIDWIAGTNSPFKTSASRWQNLPDRPIWTWLKSFYLPLSKFLQRVITHASDGKYRGLYYYGRRPINQQSNTYMLIHQNPPYHFQRIALWYQQQGDLSLSNLRAFFAGQRSDKLYWAHLLAGDSTLKEFWMWFQMHWGCHLTPCLSSSRCLT